MDWDPGPYLIPQKPPGQEPHASVSWPGVLDLAQKRELPLAEAMARLLDQGLWPERLRPNRGTFSAVDQARLLRSRAAVVGAGGLGGMVILLLARLGLGQLAVADGDVFEESNLNRQFLSNHQRLGMNKARAAAQELALINPAVVVSLTERHLDPDSLPPFLEGAGVALDCLDSMSARYHLERAAASVGVPYIHGAIAGLEGMVMTVRPGQAGLAGLYGPQPAPKEASAESFLGVPAMTPALVACLQVNEAVKVLLGRATLPPGSVVHLDLTVPGMEILNLA